MSNIKKKLEELSKEIIDAILKPSLNDEEEKALNNLKGNIDISSYKTKQLALVAGSGGLAGAVGGWLGVGLAAVDLVWCGKVAGQSCLGIGYILGREPEPDDIELILAIWTGVGTPSNTVPLGKVAIAVNETSASYQQAAFNTRLAFESAVAIICKKSAIKGSTKKLLAMVSTIGGSKLSSKLFAKMSISWIPVVGGFVCAGVNLWLVGGLLEASEKYYQHDYVILNNPEIFEVTSKL
jgi:hypothetical protein